MITAKFGGTSLCDAAHFQQVREILDQNPRRRFVVVSAPGKRWDNDVKITDLLYRCHQEARAGGSVAAAKEKGLLRSEGKDYVVKDGDMIYFRFNV